MTIDQLPERYCWRCGSVCDTDWIDIRHFAEPEPRVVQGATKCTNPRCLGAYDQCADRAPTPEQLRRRGEEALRRVQTITADVLGFTP